MFGTTVVASKPKFKQNSDKFLQFGNSHMNKDKYRLKINTKISIPLLLCPTIPRKTDLAKKELYSKIILLLFQPFTDIFRICSKFSTFSDTLDSFLKTCDAEILRFIQNLENLKKSQDDANEIKRKRNLDQTNTYYNNDLFEKKDNSTTSPFDYNEFEIDQFTSDELDNSNNVIIKDWLDKRTDVIKDYFKLEIDESLNVNLDKPIIVNTDNIFNLNKTNYVTHINLWEKQYALIRKNGLVPTQSINKKNTLLNINNITNNKPEKLQIIVTNIPLKFNLNESQIITYDLFTNLFFTKQPNQMIMFLTGEGGTGKTRLIKAIEYFFHENNASNMFDLNSSTASSANVLSPMGKLYLKIFN